LGKHLVESVHHSMMSLSWTSTRHLMWFTNITRIQDASNSSQSSQILEFVCFITWSAYHFNII
jgi:hypothetical protein